MRGNKTMNDDVFDLEEFLERIQNDWALLLELFDIFIDDFRQKRKSIDQAVVKKDYEQMRRLAHSVKGSAGNISAKSLRTAFIQFEAMAKKNDLTGIDTILTNIDQEFQKFTDRITQLKQELKA